MVEKGIVLKTSACGVLLLILAILLSVLDPMRRITQYLMRFEEGSFIFGEFSKPDYVVHQTVRVFNYTNTDRYLQGLDSKLKVEEIGPFVFWEVTEGLNVSIDDNHKVIRVTPKARLVYLPDRSLARTDDVRVIVPNLVMIVLGTLAADTLPSWSNSLVAFIMHSVSAKPFIELTVEELLWGYPDPLIDLAGTYFPGWIDFSSVGIMKLFYSTKLKEMELEAEGDRQYSIINWDGSPSLVEQGYEGPGTEDHCNTVRGAYQGIILSPNYSRDRVISLFKYQGCRVYPFSYESHGMSNIGVPYDRYVQRTDTHNASGDYACRCRSVCPPDGLTDISGCFYGFPVYVSPPHFYNADPSLMEPFEGLSPQEDRAKTFIDIDPVTGSPLIFRSSTQVSLRVRQSPYNSAMTPLGRVRFLPVLWFQLSTPDGPSDIVVGKLRFRHVYGPGVVMVTQALLVICGGILLAPSLLYVLAVCRRSRKKTQEREIIPLNSKIKA